MSSLNTSSSHTPSLDTSSIGQTGSLIRTIPVTQQATGAFDRGKITEHKPIGMPHDRAPQKGIGPLFYWAWAESEESGTIAMHPHQGFEILSYVLDGEMFHRDSLGSEGWVSAGGAQVQQAGSGLSHEEITGPAKSAFFQIWFQPDLQAALQRPPQYGDHARDEFPVIEAPGVGIKTILGAGSPISLVSDAQIYDVSLEPGAGYAHRLGAGRALVAVTVDGVGGWRSEDGEIVEPVEARDCTTIHGGGESTWRLEATDGSALRAVLIEVPLQVDYPLYR